MKQVAIIPRKQHDIGRELSDCIARLENSGIRVFATRRGQGVRHFVGRGPGDFEGRAST